MTVARPRANAEDVHALLRADLLGGVHPPGSKLKFAPLSQRYGASVSVLREALSRLSEQGLVESVPRIGFRVRDVSVADLRALTTARIDLECLTLTRAIESGDMNWESELVAAHHRLEHTPLLTTDAPPRVSDQWESAHKVFHSTLLTGCGNDWLTDYASMLRDASEFYRRWSQTQEPGRDVALEHRSIMEAALDRDAAEASERLRRHYSRTADIIERALLAVSTDQL